MYLTLPITINQESLEEYCLRHHIQRLAVFGSALRDDFTKESDLDLLVEFQDSHTPGWEIVTIADELSTLFGRRVDLRTSMDLSRYFRQEVEQEAIAIYEQD
ncbi:nucleotidyltransferase family protein [[Limnothrix rosea] IAM M-220]|uniref:nucleotidyltransferase family protein n=1 Tax=[Limnothrix rosea] IAM M-220 TaxID=454133 RepID=UPI0009647E90|nr:nucleotidyltransferase domain-containing protein [[Limnothrix rosea] IAM M-220]OKH19057.1 nucleotidyltransferase [[Limnothrix rosea] IAM M-220]